MDKRIIFDNNGTLTVLIPSDNYRKRCNDLNDSEFCQHLIKKDIPATMRASAAVVDISAIPNDRTFRDAWKKNGSKIRIDLPEARLIHQDKIDRIKDREMKRIAENIVIQQALGNDITALQDKIQDIQTAIDNVGPNINAAGTPAVLKAVWPVGLPKE